MGRFSLFYRGARLVVWRVVPGKMHLYIGVRHCREITNGCGWLQPGIIVEEDMIVAFRINGKQ